MPEPVESYASLGMEYWQKNQDRAGRAVKGPHNPGTCPCLPCADAREASNRQPLMPTFAIESKARLREIAQRENAVPRAVTVKQVQVIDLQKSKRPI
jgi:hypothetical protein